MMTRTEIFKNLPDYCLSCDSGGDVWILEDGCIKEEYKGKPLEVRGTVARCKHCGFAFVPHGAMDEIVNATKETFNGTKQPI